MNQNNPYHLPHNELLTVRSQLTYAITQGTKLQHVSATKSTRSTNVQWFSQETGKLRTNSFWVPNKTHDVWYSWRMLFLDFSHFKLKLISINSSFCAPRHWSIYIYKGNRTCSFFPNSAARTFISKSMHPFYCFFTFHCSARQSCLPWLNASILTLPIILTGPL